MGGAGPAIIKVRMENARRNYWIALLDLPENHVCRPVDEFSPIS